MKMNYFEEDVLIKLSQIPLKSLHLADDIYKGYHRSKKTGEEVEFRQFRPYIQGDDIKKIDWKSSAKKNHYLVREFEEELSYKIHIIVDNSASMGQFTSSKLTKLEYAKYLATALTYLFLKQNDQVKISVFANTLQSIFGYTNIINQIPQLNNEFNKVYPSTKTNFYNLSKLDIKKSEKIILFVLSDFISQYDQILNSLKFFVSPKIRLIVMHFVSHEEVTFPFKGEIEFIDPETNESFICHSGEIKEKFVELFHKYVNKIKQSAQNLGIEYRQVNTSTHYSDYIIDFIKAYHPKL